MLDFVGAIMKRLFSDGLFKTYTAQEVKDFYVDFIDQLRKVDTNYQAATEFVTNVFDGHFFASSDAAGIKGFCVDLVKRIA